MTPRLAILVQAMQAYEGLRAYSASYEASHVADRLFDIYVTLGSRELDAPRPTREDRSAGRLLCQGVGVPPRIPK